MPVEIRELQIKVTVNQPQSGGGEGGSSAPAQQSDATQPSTEKLIADAVEQVMTILQNKEER